MAKKKLTFEEALERIESIVEVLENEEVPLEKSISLYKEGITLAGMCREKLDKAEGEILSLQKTAEGGFLEIPFTASEEDSQ